MKLKVSMFLILTIALLFSMARAEDNIDKWRDYKKIFISSDGRVIDHQNNSISHSEGQGYGMLLSVLFDDRETFEKVWNWTKNNLWVRKSDRLFAWSWGLHPSGKWTVLDYNNASDGDILIAYSLILAWKKWKVEEYVSTAKEIVKDIRELLIVKKNRNLYLLPGYFGFVRGDYQILNPSYYVLPAIKEFAEVDRKDFWEAFYIESLNFLKNLEIGELKLPPDWIVSKNGNFDFFLEKSSNFGIEAIRIILYALMANEKTILQKFKTYLELVERINYIPFEIDLQKSQFSTKDGIAMHYLILSALSEKLGNNGLTKSLLKRGLEKLENERENYYSQTLSLILLKAGKK